MEIKTKFEIGDTIWIDEGDDVYIDVEVRSIDIRVDNSGVSVVYNREFDEEDSFGSKMEALLDKKYRMESELEKTKSMISEIEEKTEWKNA